MQLDPMEDWRRLTRTYSAMHDDELRHLAADFASLTDTARQILRDEMRKRGLGDPQSLTPPGNHGSSPQWNPTAFAPPAQTAGADLDHQFVWKNLLCECDERGEAWQIEEFLRRAGIESWTEDSQRYLPYLQLDMSRPRLRLLVAAGDLDRARAIAAQPVPQDIVEQSKTEQPDYEPPACPGCGAPDPLLEDVDPVNRWRCETCGRVWSEANAEDAPDGGAAP